MRCKIEGKFVHAERSGKYVRGQIIAGGVQRVYVDAEAMPELAEKFMACGELDALKIEADIYANTPKGGGSAYLSIKIVDLVKGRAVAGGPS